MSGFSIHLTQYLLQGCHDRYVGAEFFFAIYETKHVEVVIDVLGDDE